MQAGGLRDGQVLVHAMLQCMACLPFTTAPAAMCASSKERLRCQASMLVAANTDNTIDHSVRQKAGGSQRGAHGARRRGGPVDEAAYLPKCSLVSCLPDQLVLEHRLLVLKGLHQLLLLLWGEAERAGRKPRSACVQGLLGNQWWLIWDVQSYNVGPTPATSIAAATPPSVRQQRNAWLGASYLHRQGYIQIQDPCSLYALLHLTPHCPLPPAPLPTFLSEDFSSSVLLVVSVMALHRWLM
jgi:hypothetical protein